MSHHTPRERPFTGSEPRRAYVRPSTKLHPATRRADLHSDLFWHAILAKQDAAGEGTPDHTGHLMAGKPREARAVRAARRYFTAARTREARRARSGSRRPLDGIRSTLHCGGKR